MCLHDVGRDLEAGRRVLARVGDQRLLHAGDHLEIRIVDAKRRISQELRNHIDREKTDGFAVGHGLGELIGADHAAGAAHVLDDDGGLARNVRGQMLGDDAPLDIGRAAGRVVDDHGDGLALVELGTRGVCEDRGGERDYDGEPCSDHGFGLQCEQRTRSAPSPEGRGLA